MLSLLKVTGNSLAPAYLDGDFVFVSKIPIFFGIIKPGDILVFNHDEYGTMIKRVERITRQGNEVIVSGTHENSISREKIGPVRRDAVKGKVIWHISRSK